MTCDDILDQAIALLQRRERVTYRTLKRQFQLDEEALEDLKEELLYSHPEVVDDEGRGLIWTATPTSASSPSPPAPLPASAPARQPQEPPISYTPRYLTEKILASRGALEGERKQVTVLFADIKDSTELIRNLDPENAQKLLDPAIHIMMEAVPATWEYMEQCLARYDPQQQHRNDLRYEGPSRGVMGLGHMREGLAVCRATGSELDRPWVFGLLAEVYGRGRQAEDGLRMCHDI